jgi:hypothetical protein
MKTKLLKIGRMGFAVIAALLFTASPAFSNEEDGLIKIRLSYKIIINPKNCARPNPTAQVGEIVTDEMIAKAVEEMNALLAATWRGYRFELKEIKEIGSRGDAAPKPGHWFDVDFIEEDKQNKLMNEMEAAIKANPTQYAWREDAINIYLNQNTSGAKWKCKDLIIVGARSASMGWVQLHEIGHYFGLRHTHGDLGVVQPGQSGAGYTTPGDDKVEDTIQDLPCWNRDGIAKHNFSAKYEQLEAAQKALVDDVAENLMSYHFLKPMKADLRRLTEGQMDRWADTAEDFYRKPVRDGRTWFVDRQTPGNEGTSTYPCDSVKLAAAAANDKGGDIIVLRPGEYHETLTISKPVTLRATRKGPATIGAPVALLAMSAE